jgi:hypothetical protein
VILKNFFGRDLTHLLFFNIHNKVTVILFFTLIFFSFVLFFLLFLKKIKKDKILFLLLILFITQSLLAFFGSKMNQVQGRYAVIPSFLLITIIYRIYQIQIKNNFIKKLSLTLITFSLITGAYQYKYNARYPEFLDCYNCPIWKDEIYKWKINNDYKIKIWNYPARSMLLK